MTTFLICLAVLALSAQAFIGLGFLVSSIREREKRASFFAALQFAGMLLALAVFILIAKSGFFRTSGGGFLLIAGTLLSAVAVYFLIRRTEPDQKALQGAKGHIVGKIKRVDERGIVFARIRLVPGSKEFETFYKENPEMAEVDEERRKKKTVLGTYGSINAPSVILGYKG